MSRSWVRSVLAPALGAGLVTGTALLLGADAVVIVAGSALGALVGNFIGSQGDEVKSAIDPVQTQDVQPNVLASATRLNAVLDGLPIGVLLVDPDRRVTAANATIREIFALPDQPGYPVETLRAQRMLRAVEEVRTSGQPTQFEMTLSRRADIALQAHVVPLSDAPSKTRLLIAVQDITKARIADEVHRDFVANASHELKTPLAVVSGLIDTLQGAARNDPAGTERFLNRLASQTARMTRLIDDLMSLNRIEINERVMPRVLVKLTALVAEVVDALRPAAEAMDVVLEFDPDGGATVLADREELEQLFVNLIDNGIKYGRSGGQVRVEITGTNGGDEVAISVSDKGPGIAREHLPRLTERFYRVDVGRSREHGGTGLGLAICKHIVSRHRGRIEIESVVDEGTRFTVRLPIIATAGADSSETLA